MRYGDSYRSHEIPAELIGSLDALVGPQARETATTIGPQSVRRSSHVVWVKDPALIAQFLQIAQIVNRAAGWDLHIDVLEPLQYTEYMGGDEYGWHSDQHGRPYPDNRVRKISFSIFLNDDFDGGEFDLEVGGPDAADRIVTFARLAPNTALFFQSDMWHRVRPVTRGMRKSLVGWVLGPKFR